jgi:fumarate reductase subunit D
MIARTIFQRNLHRNPHKTLHRTNLLWVAALLHRLSGLGLATFLPLHFITLALAIDGEARLDSVLRWSEAPMVKLGEAVLMFLLAVHALGGLRLLALENLGWGFAAQSGQKRHAAVAVAVAGCVAIAFLFWLF